MKPAPARRSTASLRGVRFTKVGAPSALRDPYHWLMEIGWLPFTGVVTASFLATDLVFAALYALMPRAIANMPDGSLLYAFFFSVQTLSTVGYGAMSPSTLGGHVVVTIELASGLFFYSTVTGLIFARFSRPRVMLVCSHVAVVARYGGGRALMIRVASLRSHPVTDMTAQLFWLRRTAKADGEKVTDFIPLPLTETGTPVLALSWMLVHPIDADAAVLEALRHDPDTRLLLKVSGTYSLLGSPTLSDRVYKRDDIRTDAEFVDIVSEHEGTFTLDLSRLDDTRPQVGHA